jgi:putative DNA primase/helicase
MSSVNPENIPQELRAKKQWVGWRYEERDGKKTKVPITLMVRGQKRASSTNSMTWGDFECALRSYQEPSNDLDGIGFVFNNDFIGVDLDNAIDDAGHIKSWAAEILEQCPTYAERSPSGRGIHLISRGSLPKDCPGTRRTYHDGAVEIYSRGRFFTMTGDVISGSLIDHDSRELYTRIRNGNNRNGATRKHISTVNSTDIRSDDRLEAALKDSVFSRLWYGDISTNNNDDSAADLAFCNKIVFYFGKDPDAVDRVFRQSKLYREKWERQDYHEWTINKAINDTSETYSPKRKTGKTGDTTGQAASRSEPINEPRKENSDDDIPKLTPSLKNAVRVILEQKLADVWFDDFLNRPMTGKVPREWIDADDLELCIRVQSVRGFSKIGLETVRNAALTIAFRHRKNCVKDWLNSLPWDKEPRIDHVFEDHFGAVGNEYTRAASRNFWISMVARVYQPGCKVDNMVVLEGEQGKKKSSALDIIGGAWFAEQHENVTSREFFQVLQAKLLIEISELDAFSRSDVTKVKQVVSCRSDRYREPYGRHAKDHPRQCVFAGTTNKDDWNRDETGGRRFWPIACHGDIDLDGIRACRDQCFAEAVDRFKKSEIWWEMPPDETRTEQASRYVPPAWAEPIEKYITHEWIEKADGSGGFHWSPRTPRTELSVSEILEYALDIPKSQWTKANEMRVGEALRFLGWTKQDVWRNGKTVKRWLLLHEGGKASEGDKA